MGTSYLPDRDPALLAWSLNFSTKISAAPITFGLTAPLATSYGALHASFAAALSACDPTDRTKSLVAAKNAARTSLKNQARLLAKLVDGTASVTDAQKLDIGLNVPAPKTPLPVPPNAPVVEVVKRMGTQMQIRLHDVTGDRRGKPVGCAGARIYSFIGTAPPVDVNDWTFEGQATRTIIDLEFPAGTAPGAVVWLTACWYNPRGECGIAAAPISTNIAGGAIEVPA